MAAGESLAISLPFTARPRTPIFLVSSQNRLTTKHTAQPFFSVFPGLFPTSDHHHLCHFTSSFARLIRRPDHSFLVCDGLCFPCHRITSQFSSFLPSLTFSVISTPRFLGSLHFTNLSSSLFHVSTFLAFFPFLGALCFEGHSGLFLFSLTFFGASPSAQPCLLLKALRRCLLLLLGKPCSTARMILSHTLSLSHTNTHNHCRLSSVVSASFCLPAATL